MKEKQEFNWQPDCLTCQIDIGASEIKPIGGTIWQGRQWSLEHALSPMGKWGVGTLILKTKRHVESFSALNEEEEPKEFARILRKTIAAMQQILDPHPDKVFINSWGTETKHLHFVLQPIYPGQMEALFADEKDRELRGPVLQVKMANLNQPLPEQKVLNIVNKLKQELNKTP